MSLERIEWGCFMINVMHSESGILYGEVDLNRFIPVRIGLVDPLRQSAQDRSFLF